MSGVRTVELVPYALSFGCSVVIPTWVDMAQFYQNQHHNMHCHVDKARKGDTQRIHGVVAPEAAGLPLDESFNFLALMKR